MNITDVRTQTCATCANGIGRDSIICFAPENGELLCSEYPPEHVCEIGKWEERER